MKTLRLSLAAVALVLAAACSVSPTEPAADTSDATESNTIEIVSSAEGVVGSGH